MKRLQTHQWSLKNVEDALRTFLCFILLFLAVDQSVMFFSFSNHLLETFPIHSIGAQELFFAHVLLCTYFVMKMTHEHRFTSVLSVLTSQFEMTIVDKFRTINALPLTRFDSSVDKGLDALQAVNKMKCFLSILNDPVESLIRVDRSDTRGMI